MTYFLTENPESFNYFISFIVTLVHGEILEVELHRLNKQPAKEYQDAVKKLGEQVKATQKRHKSFWFRWIYIPWRFLISLSVCLIVGVLSVMRFVVLWLAHKLTPF